MTQVRVAILGQGRSGRDIHAYSLAKLSERYEIVAVVDAIAERRVRAERELGCAAYVDYRELFERNDIDLVINTLPSSFHVPVTLEFLTHGFNVLCEKPLARSAGEVDQLIDAAQRSGCVLAIYQQSRFAPAFQQLRQVIESGALGRIVQVNIAFSGFSRRWDWQTSRP